MPRILLAEDDEIMRVSVSDRLKKFGWRVDEAEDGNQAMRLFEKNRYHLVISDIRMPGLDGLSLLNLILQQSPDTDVIIMTAYGSVDAAIDCLRQGATDYILKPFDMDNLIIRVNRLLDVQEVKNKYEVLEENCIREHDHQLIGSSALLQELRSLIDRVAPTDTTVLITGESGTGKEMAARSIHFAGKRREKPFVSINCAAIPEGLMESELFGHERGAFTGADQQRKGKFELADNGTLLLDELGDLPLPLQAKLLRVLQESSFERVGGSKSIQVDVRILACTSKNLGDEVKAERFRQDLLYRLQVIHLEMPPLRTHKEDIGELCSHFLDEFRWMHGRKVTIGKEAVESLKNYDFPGNARELRNLLERAFVLTRGERITVADLPGEVSRLKEVCEENLNLRNTLSQAEQRCIRKALEQCRGNRTEASQLLGISRKNLWEKMKSHGLE